MFQAAMFEEINSMEEEGKVKYGNPLINHEIAPFLQKFTALIHVLNLTRQDLEAASTSKFKVVSHFMLYFTCMFYAVQSLNTTCLLMGGLAVAE